MKARPRLIRGGLEPERLLDAAWQSTRDTETVVWRFQLPTRAYGFEFKAPPFTGDVLSIVVGVEEQLAVAFPLAMAVQFHERRAITTSPDEGWKLGPIVLPSFGPGVELRVRLVGFEGQLRPFGIQLGGGARDPGAPLLVEPA